MPNNDFYTMTPGSAVADGIQEILARRKAEQRQAMLDQLNAKNVQSEMDYRKGELENAASTRKTAERAATLREWEARSKMSGGQGADELDPTLRDEGMHLGFIQKSKPATTTSSSFDLPLNTGEAQSPDDLEAMARKMEAAPPAAAPDAQTHYTYSSSGEQQDDELRKVLLQKFLDDPKTPVELKQWGKLRQGLPKGESLPAPTTWTGDDEVPLTEFDAETNKWSHPMIDGKPVTGKKGQGPVVRPRPAQPNAAAQPQLVQIPDGKGGFTSSWLKPGQTLKEGTNIGGDNGPIIKGNVPKPTAAGNQTAVDPRFTLALQAAKTPAQQKQAINSLIGSYKTTQGAKMIVQQIIGDPSRPSDASVEDIMAGVTGTDAEKAAIQDMVTIILGQNAR